MPKTYSIHQPRRCGNGAAFRLDGMQSDCQAVCGVEQALERKISETLATYGRRRTRRMVEKMLRAPQKKNHERGRP